MNRTRNYHLRAGGADSLGSLQKQEEEKEKKRYKRTPCRRKHVWNRSKFSRQCSKCGLIEEKDATGNWEPI